VAAACRGSDGFFAAGFALVRGGVSAAVAFGLLSPVTAGLRDMLLDAVPLVFGAAGSVFTGGFAGFGDGASAFARGADGFAAGAGDFAGSGIAAAGAGIARWLGGKVGVSACVLATGAAGVGEDDGGGDGDVAAVGADFTSACCVGGGFTASRMYGTATAPMTPSTIKTRTARNQVAAKIERGASSSYLSGSSSSLRSSRSGLIGLDSAISCAVS
jgi:hypothetical protein